MGSLLFVVAAALADRRRPQWRIQAEQQGGQLRADLGSDGPPAQSGGRGRGDKIYRVGQVFARPNATNGDFTMSRALTRNMSWSAWSGCKRLAVVLAEATTSGG